MTDQPKRRDVSEAFRRQRQRAEAERSKPDRLADLGRGLAALIPQPVVVPPKPLDFDTIDGLMQRIARPQHPEEFYAHLREIEQRALWSLPLALVLRAFESGEVTSLPMSGDHRPAPLVDVLRSRGPQWPR